MKARVKNARRRLSKKYGTTTATVSFESKLI